MHMRSTYFLFSCSLMHDPCIFLCKTKTKKGKHENSRCMLSCIYSVPWAKHVGIINPFHLKTKWVNMVPNARLTRKWCFFGHLNLIITFSMHSVATYPSAVGRRETHGCVSQERKMRGVATNVYLRKTSKKPERCGLRTLSVKGSGVIFTHGDGISTPRVRHKGRQPLIKCANMTSNCLIFPFLHFYVFLRLLYFLSFCGRQGCFLCSYVFLNCDKEIRPTQFF